MDGKDFSNQKNMRTEQTKQVGEIISGLLTATRERPTQAGPNPIILKRFEKLAQFQTHEDAQLIKMFSAAQKFAASINYTRPYWLLLAGATGTGKSHLAHKIWKQFMDQNRFELKLDAANNRIVGNTAMWIDWRRFCKDLRSGGFEEIEDVIKEWFVVIDDIGASRDPSGFVTDVLDQIIAGRDGKWTMMTSNLTLEEMADTLDVRIADRMLRGGGVVIEVDTISFNQRPRL